MSEYTFKRIPGYSKPTVQVFETGQPVCTLSFDEDGRSYPFPDFLKVEHLAKAWATWIGAHDVGDA